MENFYHIHYGHADKNGSLVLFYMALVILRRKRQQNVEKKGFFLLEKDKEST